MSIINLYKLTRQLFVDSINKIIKKSINITEADQERVKKKNENPIRFISIISTLQKSIDTIRNQTKSHNFCYFSDLSQAYVFYNLSQTQVINLDKLRYVFKYHDYGIYFFLKTEIKDSFEEIIDSELSPKRPLSYGTNDWKNWLKRLKRHYQYNLSPSRWSRLLSQRWRNKVYQHHMDENLNKDSSEKDRLIFFKKQNDVEVYSLGNQKENFQKYSRYDLLSYQSLNSENEKNKGDSSSSGLPFEFETQVNRKQDRSYNSTTHKYNFFDMCGRSPITNYIGKSDMKSMEKHSDRKYFDWKTLHFGLKQKIAIEYWIKIDIQSNLKTKSKTNNYQISDKIAKKSLFYLKLPKNPKIKVPNPPKTFLDWMGMNEEILRCPVSTLDLWLFPEFLLLYNLYKMKPWVIPSKVLLLPWNRNANVRSENKNITDNPKVECGILSNKKNSNRKQKEKELPSSQRDLRPDAQNQMNLECHSSTNQQKDIEERSKVQGGKKKKQYKSKTEAELDLFLKRYSLFQLRWGDVLNQRMINNIKIYCLLLRLLNPRRIALSSIQRREMTLDILLSQKNFSLVELIKRGILVIEPVRLSVKNDAQFILYQTLGISLVHKSKHKHQNNQEYPKQVDVDKNAFDLLVPETIFSHKYRREFRLKSCFNSKKTNRNPIFCTENNCSQFLDKNKKKYLEKEKNELMKLKLILWPNYRLEDLACMNRYWFDTNNGSRFSMLRIYIYPGLKRCW